MPTLSNFAQQQKIKYFLKQIPLESKILEIGSGSGWVGDYFKLNGHTNYTGIDIVPPADVVGDICKWNELGLQPSSYDFIIAFEVFEHVNCTTECYELLKQSGKLLVTTPVPHMDWVMKILEFIGLNQKRTSPHDHLIYLQRIDCFTQKEIKIITFLAQWGIFTK